jgi:hypothetical protein
MGIDPKIWGPSAWFLIHTIAFQVKTKNDMNFAKHLVYSFLYILPCDKCRRNFDKHLISLPFPNNATDAAKWSYKIHSRISGDDFTWQEAKDRWSQSTLSWHDIYPFLEAVGHTHPTLRHIDACYRDNLIKFVESISHFMKDAPDVRLQEIGSKTVYVRWLSKIKRMHSIQYHTLKKTSCTTTCLLHHR